MYPPPVPFDSTRGREAGVPLVLPCPALCCADALARSFLPLPCAAWPSLPLRPAAAHARRTSLSPRRGASCLCPVAAGAAQCGCCAAAVAGGQLGERRGGCRGGGRGRARG